MSLISRYSVLVAIVYSLLTMCFSASHGWRRAGLAKVSLFISAPELKLIKHLRFKLMSGSCVFCRGYRWSECSFGAGCKRQGIF